MMMIAGFPKINLEIILITQINYLCKQDQKKSVHAYCLSMYDQGFYLIELCLKILSSFGVIYNHP
jgi:hypothetical protein